MERAPTLEFISVLVPVSFCSLLFLRKKLAQTIVPLNIIIAFIWQKV